MGDHVGIPGVVLDSFAAPEPQPFPKFNSYPFFMSRCSAAAPTPSHSLLALFSNALHSAIIPHTCFPLLCTLQSSHTPIPNRQTICSWLSAPIPTQLQLQLHSPCIACGCWAWSGLSLPGNPLPSGSGSSQAIPLQFPLGDKPLSLGKASNCAAGFAHWLRSFAVAAHGWQSNSSNVRVVWNCVGLCCLHCCDCCVH